MTDTSSGTIESTQASPGLSGWVRRIAFVIGSAGLLIAMGADAIAVLGRHLGIPAVGAIEIVQASVVLIAGASMIIATQTNSHARVHILVNRLKGGQQVAFAAIAELIFAALFLLIALGSVWIASELWYGFEVTELLRIPLRWLRVFWIGSTLVVALLCLANIATACLANHATRKQHS